MSVFIVDCRFVFIDYTLFHVDFCPNTYIIILKAVVYFTVFFFVLLLI